MSRSLHSASVTSHIPPHESTVSIVPLRAMDWRSSAPAPHSSAWAEPAKSMLVRIERSAPTDSAPAGCLLEGNPNRRARQAHSTISRTHSVSFSATGLPCPWLTRRVSSTVSGPAVLAAEPRLDIREFPMPAPPPDKRPRQHADHATDRAMGL